MEKNGNLKMPVLAAAGDACFFAEVSPILRFSV